MAQLSNLTVTGSARFVNVIEGTSDIASKDADGNVISSTYMRKGIDYVTAGRRGGTTAGQYSTTEGYSTTASATYSHAEGYSTTASNTASHAEGYQTTASGYYAHSEGSQTKAYGDYSHAEGGNSEAGVSGSTVLAAHADGCHTKATANYSHASGYYTTAASVYQLVIGKYNAIDSDSKYSFIIGYGTSTSARKNVFSVTRKGMITLGYAGDRIVPSTRATSQTTVPNLIEEVRYLNGAMGSVSIVTAYTASSVTLPTGWYNYLYIPHRHGGEDGAASGDNHKYGVLLMFGMNNANGCFWIRYADGAVRFMNKFNSS